MFELLAKLIMGNREAGEIGYYKRLARVENRLKKAFVAVILISVVLGSVYVAATAVPQGQECAWEQCHCFETHDVYGAVVNENNMDFHCAVHGDGHDCY